MATHYNILTLRIPWTEESGGLQCMGSQRVRHVWSDLAHIAHTINIPIKQMRKKEAGKLQNFSKVVSPVSLPDFKDIVYNY